MRVEEGESYLFSDCRVKAGAAVQEKWFSIITSASEGGKDISVLINPSLSLSLSVNKIFKNILSRIFLSLLSLGPLRIMLDSQLCIQSLRRPL